MKTNANTIQFKCIGGTMFRVSIHIESESTVVVLFKKIQGILPVLGNWGLRRRLSYVCYLQKRIFLYLYHFQFHHIIRVKSFSFLHSSENYVHFASSLLSRGKSFNGVFWWIKTFFMQWPLQKQARCLCLWEARSGLLMWPGEGL